MFRNVLLLILFLNTGLSLFGNEQSLTFTDVYYHFGTRYQSDPTFLYTFYFENSSDSIVTINNIHSTCGCVAVKDYTKLIKPGEKGEIQVEVLPSTQIGRFAESILVFVEADGRPYVLKVDGQVIAGSRNQKLTFNIGSVYMPSRQINFGYIKNGDSRKLLLPLKNTSEDTVLIQPERIPSFVDIFIKPSKIIPGGYAVLDISFFSTMLNDWDFVYESLELSVINLKTNSAEKGKITVAANIREDFSLLTTEDSANAPVAKFDSEVYNFGVLSESDTATYRFTVVNRGKSELIIRKVRPSCGCTVVVPDAKVLQPGESAHIETKFICAGYNGKVKKGITVITNDPVNYKHYLWVEGVVKE